MRVEDEGGLTPPQGGGGSTPPFPVNRNPCRAGPRRHDLALKAVQETSVDNPITWNKIKNSLSKEFGRERVADFFIGWRGGEVWQGSSPRHLFGAQANILHEHRGGC